MLALDFGGVEVYYPKHDAEDTARYKAMAEQRGLLMTGGSDFHAVPQREPLELGVFTVPDELAVPLFHPPQGLQ
jgi:hypothetical protein